MGFARKSRSLLGAMMSVSGPFQTLGRMPAKSVEPAPQLRTWRDCIGIQRLVLYRAAGRCRYVTDSASRGIVKPPHFGNVAALRDLFH